MTFRHSCYYCKYARKERVGDFTIGDFDSEKLYPTFFPNECKSVLTVNTELADSVWKAISSSFNFIDIDYEEETKRNSQLRHPSEKPSYRIQIYLDLRTLRWNKFVRKYNNC